MHLMEMAERRCGWHGADAGGFAVLCGNDRLLAGGRRRRLASGVVKGHCRMRRRRKASTSSSPTPRARKKTSSSCARLHRAEGRRDPHRAGRRHRLGPGSIAEPRKAGIPVFLADRDVDVKDKSLFVTRISADFNLEGVSLARGLPRLARAHATSSKSRHRRRRSRDRAQEGLRIRRGAFPGHQDRQTQSGDFTTDGGKKVMEAFIKSTDNLKGICASFAHNDNMQLGAISGDEGSRP